MATPPQKAYVARIQFVDHAGKPSHITFDVSAADYAAWLTDATAGNIRTLMNTYEAMSLDNVVRESVDEVAFVQGTGAFPASEDAVNSAKLLILEQDVVTGEHYRNYIPARFSGNFTSVRGQVILGTGGTTQVQALVTALEATQKSEDGNALTVNEIRVVGRGTGA